MNIAMQSVDASQIVTKQVGHEDRFDALMVLIGQWAGVTEPAKGRFSAKYRRKKNILSVTVGGNSLIYMSKL